MRMGRPGDVLLLHGLWPQYTAESSAGAWWPQFCGEFSKCEEPAHFNDDDCDVAQTVRKRYASKWKDIAPAYPYADGAKPARGAPFNYLDHEWAKHGTCTILSTTTYIDEQIRLMALQPTPEMLRKKVNFKLAELQHLFAFDKAGANVSQQTGLACDEGGRLFGVTTCWGTGSNGTVGQRMHCPDSITHSKYSNGCLEYDDIVVLQSRANGDGRDLQSWVIPSVVAVVISALVLLIGLVFARQHRRRKAAAEAEYNARLIR
eukprot:g803.t1